MTEVSSCMCFSDTLTSIVRGLIPSRVPRHDNNIQGLVYHCHNILSLLLAGVDYTSTPVTVTFSAGASSESIVIPIADDMFVERRETFTVTLSSNETLAQFVPGEDSATISIVDDDGMQHACLCDACF